MCLRYERVKQMEEREEFNLITRGGKAHHCDEKDNSKYSLKGKKRYVYVWEKQKLHERRSGFRISRFNIFYSNPCI